MSELAEALRDSDDIKKERNETQKENKDLRERLENVEKTLRMKSQLHRSANGHSHRFVCLHRYLKYFEIILFCFHEFFCCCCFCSHDSAIDSDLQEWETEAIDLDMAGMTHFCLHFIYLFFVCLQFFVYF